MEHELTVTPEQTTAPAAGSTTIAATADTIQVPLQPRTDPLASILADAQQQNAQRRRMAIASLGMLAMATIVMASPTSRLAFLAYIVAAVLVMSMAVQFAVRYRRTTAALARVDDLRVVGPLIERLRTRRRGRMQRRMIRQALIRLLPRLRATDAGLLTDGQKAHLAGYLGRLARFQRDKEFQVAILRALEQVGDASAVPVVQRIVDRQPRWSAQEEVHAAAARCLPFLLQRAEQERNRDTLLRPAGGGTPSESLVRPAGGDPEIDTAALLRPAATDAE